MIPVKYIISNVMCYTMLCMLKWMQKEKHRIGTEHESYVVQPCRPTSTEESLKGYIFIMYKNVVQ